MTFSDHPDPQYQQGFYDNVPSKRLVAWVIDSVLVLILCVLLVPFTGFLGLLVWPAFWMVIGFAYRVVTLSMGSATWGMKAMSIELRDAQGERLDLSQAFLHTLGYSVSIAVPILQVISIVLMLTSDRKQGLTDMLMGTVAINRRLTAA